MKLNELLANDPDGKPEVGTSDGKAPSVNDNAANAIAAPNWEKLVKALGGTVTSNADGKISANLPNRMSLGDMNGQVLLRFGGIDLHDKAEILELWKKLGLKVPAGAFMGLEGKLKSMSLGFYSGLGYSQADALKKAIIGTVKHVAKETVKEARNSNYTMNMTVEPGEGQYGEVEVEVEFDYEPASSTQHEPDDPTTREYHPASVEIISVKSTEEFEEFDEDGEVVKKFPKGTDMEKLEGWTKGDLEHVDEKVGEHIEAQADDDDEDYGQRRRRRYW